MRTVLSSLAMIIDGNCSVASFDRSPIGQRSRARARAHRRQSASSGAFPRNFAAFRIVSTISRPFPPASVLVAANGGGRQARELERERESEREGEGGRGDSRGHFAQLGGSRNASALSEMRFPLLHRTLDRSTRRLTRESERDRNYTASRRHLTARLIIRFEINRAVKRCCCCCCCCYPASVGCLLVGGLIIIRGADYYSPPTDICRKTLYTRSPHDVLHVGGRERGPDRPDPRRDNTRGA